MISHLLLFATSLFLIKIPPFYIIPLIKSSLLTTHTLARLIILFLFLKIIFIDKKIIVKKNRPILTIFLLYFGLLSISIISANNLGDFFLRFKDVFFPGLFLFLVLGFKNQSKPIVNVLIWTSIVNFIYQMIIFVSPNFFISFGNFFVYSKHLDLILINLNRARIFIETYDEIVIPFVLLFLWQEKTLRKKVFLYSILVFITLPSFLSNFRSRILMLTFSYAVSFIFLAKKSLAQKFLIFTFLIFIGYVSYSILNYNFNFSFFDRFALVDKKEDLSTITYRWSNIITSEEMARSKPFFGVGLGNYYDNLPPEKKNVLSLANWQNKEASIASTNPHNIFAQILSESGFISLVFYFIMLSYFFITDVKIMFQGKGFIKATVISFWSLFLYSLFNPTTSLTYNSLFWVLRAMIHNENTN